LDDVTTEADLHLYNSQVLIQHKDGINCAQDFLRPVVYKRIRDACTHKWLWSFAVFLFKPEIKLSKN